MAIDAVTAHFDSVASTYDEVLPFFSGFAAKVAHRLVRDGVLATGTRVLDVGAGRGALAREALARGCVVTAVDGSSRMVELLAHDLPAATTAVMDVQRLTLPTSSYDVVLGGFVVHVVPDARAMLTQVRRVLVPGGRLALTVPGRADGSPEPWEDPVNDLVRAYRRHTPDGDGRHGNDDDEVEVLAELGFTDSTMSTLELALPVPDGDTYWRWMASHGAGTMLAALPDDRRAELRARMADLVASSGGTTLRRSATLVVARTPT